MIVRYCVIFIAHLLVHGCALACVYRKHAAQVPHAPAAARFPLSPEAVDKDCALIAYAFGYDAAAFGPSGTNGTSHCTIYDVTEPCAKSELRSGSVSFTSITDCDATTAEAIKAESIEIFDSGQEFVSDLIVAKKIPDVAAVGTTVANTFKASTGVECLHACANFIKDCAIVTVGNDNGGPVECLFHDDGVRLAVPASGFDTYSIISSTRAPPPLGDLVPEMVRCLPSVCKRLDETFDVQVVESPGQLMDPGVEVSPDPAPEPQPDPEPSPMLETETEPEANPELEPNPEPEPMPASEPQPKDPPQSQPKPPSKPKTKPPPIQQPQPEPEPAPEPDLKPEPEPQPNPPPKPQTKPPPMQQPEPEPKPEPQPEPEPEPAPEPEPKPEPEPDPEPAPEPQPKPPPPPRNPPPSSSLESLLISDPSTCGPVMSSIPTGRHLSTLKVPDEALDEYGFQPGDTLKLAYSTIKKGGEYCTAERSKEKKVVFGGMMFWQNNGQCHLPPTQSNGEPCCEVFMWQPNTGGYYYDNCSMRMEIAGDGSWWFETEMPGDESKVGWGPDPAPHIHYDVRCSGCQASSAFSGKRYQYWSKFYAEEICVHERCGNVNKQEHLSQRTKGPDGETVYKYNFVLPAQGK